MSAIAVRYNTAKPRYTYADYATWPEYPRFELIEGEAIQMSAPSWEHQEISMALSGLFWTFLRGKKCRVLAAPFDVRLNFDTLDNTVVQPDLVVICDLDKLSNKKNCLGAPDMAIEILSSSTRSMDKLRKYNIYREFGVREYWVVDPFDRLVEVYVLENEKYTSFVYDDTSTIPVHILEGCEINLAEVFPPNESPASPPINYPLNEEGTVLTD
ncbi:MAG: Uma2 family endonuclease [Defluviitaleaceae bacterium]|nr:Uma2 family endonuclease [Defluviitaleaceae bacterium]MCL2275560.1 Uma2 family endonuclease [Defluviitaleaceae bacterium]